MQRSESLLNLAPALAKAQGAIQNAAKDRANDFYGSKYADLAAIWDSVRAPLAANGLSVPQFVSTTPPVHMGKSLVREKDGSLVLLPDGTPEEMDDYLAYVVVETMLLHESGEYMLTTIELPVWNPNPQKIGSASTYGRRYALQSIAGVAAEVDDDGNASSGAQPPAAPQGKPAPRREPPRPPQQQKAPARAEAPAGKAAPAAPPPAQAPANDTAPAPAQTATSEPRVEPDPAALPAAPPAPALKLKIREHMLLLGYSTGEKAEARCRLTCEVGSAQLTHELATRLLDSLKAEAATKEAANG